MCWSILNAYTWQPAGRPSAAAMKAREQELVPHLIRFLLDHPRLKAREKVPPGSCLLNRTHCAWCLAHLTRLYTSGVTAYHSSQAILCV
jgi:hypothetical protein